MIDQVTQKSGAAIDAVLAIAEIDTAGPVTVAINHFGVIATLQGLRPLLLKSTAPRAVAVSSIISIHPYDLPLPDAMLDGTEEPAARSWSKP
jgi:hypothetical protein